MDLAEDVLLNCERSNRPRTVLVNAYQQLWHLAYYDVYQRFIFVISVGQPCVLAPSLLGVSICHLTTAHAFGLRISDGLHEEPLPASDAFLGYRWSYSGFSIASAAASEQ
ncbi:hypothetical protein BCAR13_80113 [Paraburkholderia caribensis]|nr:hypothetical protein BCAR13_80113 [Paraburkholderia caribensis]